MTPTRTREAEGVYELARTLVEQHGTEGVLRIRNALTIAIHRNTLTIVRDADNAIVTAIEGEPPMFAVFKPGAWKHILKRRA